MHNAGIVGLMGIAVLGGPIAAQADQGQDTYQRTCITCHGPNGKGLIPGVPDFTKQGGVLTKPNDVLLKHVLEGFQSPGSPMPMPPKGGNPSLTEAQVLAAIDYLRSAFGK